MVEISSPDINGETLLFLSYAHVDNDTADKEHRGWVSQFDLSLTNELKQRGLLHIDLWRDKRDIPDHRRFDPEIRKGLERARLLLSVLSPVYVQRDYCVQELCHFVRSAGPDAMERVFKVVKRWRDHLEEPEPLKGRVGYRFFEIDPESEREIPYYNPGGGKARPEYWDVMGRLADDIEAVLRPSGRAELDDAAASFVEATVFVAMPTSDLRERYWQLAHELKRNRVRVVPDPEATFPTTAADADRVITEAVKEADLAVHFLGRTLGFTPEGASRPIVQLQLDATCAKSAAHESFHRLIWIAPDNPGPTSEQQTLITALRSGDQLLRDDELVEERFEQLKALVIERVQRLRGDDASPGDGIRAKIYVMCDELDIALAEKIADVLADAGCDVTIPVVEGTRQSREEFDFYTLRTCHAALLVFGEASELWVRQTLDRLENWSNLDRKGPFQARAVLLAPPETDRKRRFRPTNADLVTWAIDTINRDRLMPFLQRLGEG